MKVITSKTKLGQIRFLETRWNYTKNYQKQVKELFPGNFWQQVN